MATQRTLSIIKPDATRRNLTGAINKRFEESGLAIVAQRRVRLTEAQARAFYAVHKERSFYDDLCAYMTSGPVVVQVLQGENAVEANRTIMGATNPANAAPGTIRRNSASRLRPTPRTARIRRKTRPSRSPSSSRRPISSAEPAAGLARPARPASML